MFSCISFLKWTAILLALSLGLLLVLFKPPYLTHVNYKGESAGISRDDFNIPTITAPSRRALFYAWGTVTAEDRLFQMAFKQLVIQGRLAEHLGEKGLEMDKFMRELNFPKWGQKMATKMLEQHPEEYEVFEAYAEGINDRVLALHVLPIDFYLIGLKWENWTVSHLTSMYKLIEWSQSMGIFDELTHSNLLHQHSKQQIDQYFPVSKEHWAFQSTTIFEDEEIPDRLRSHTIANEGKQIRTAYTGEEIELLVEQGVFDFLSTTVEGSNSWVISGEHTATGQPILANDPHLENNIPSQWYQIKADYFHNGSKLSIQGVSMPGAALLIGKTDYLAVGVTTIYCDNIDLYKEHIESNKYLLQGKWRDLKQREVVIKVKVAGGMREERYTVRETFRGPVITRFFSSLGSYHLKDPLSVAWVGFHDNPASMVAVTHIPEITSLQGIQQFLKNDFFNLNLVFSTIDGHIGYQQMGIYPIRPHPSHGDYVKDGTTTAYDWLGLLPPGDRLQKIDPENGYIVTANNKIASKLYLEGMLENSIYTARSDRIHELISGEIAASRKITVEKTKQFLADTVDVYCRQILPTLMQHIPAAGVELKDFDCDFTAESHQATIYEVFFFQLNLLVEPHRQPNMSTLSLHPTYQYLFSYIRNPHNRPTLHTAWQAALANLTSHFATPSRPAWQWGLYHQDSMHHLPFAASPLKWLYDRSFPGRGNMHTVNVGKMNKIGFGNFEVSHRANYRAIFSGDDNWWVIDSGSSECFFSPHYDDQWTFFKNNRMLPINPPPSDDDL